MKLCIKVCGVVQGVGFRPFAKRLAEELSLSGNVRNADGIVIINITGDKEALDEYVRRLTLNAPVSSSIIHMDVKEVNEENIEEQTGFQIVYSKPEEGDAYVPIISPDIATCENCEKEYWDESDRRAGHPFISCTDCGPRYSIIKNIPYDRDTITMDVFEMCEACKEEYSDIKNRRCHAQTIACKECGPKLKLHVYNNETDKYKEINGEYSDILKTVVTEMIYNGDIVAVKDIGGYHFVCRVDDKRAIDKLRTLKKRQSKSFAIMFKNIDEIKKYAFVTAEEEEILTGRERPIVFVRKRMNESNISEACIDSMYIGAMLPCNPVQIYLCNEGIPLIMTSGNQGGEPIVTDDEKMIRLALAKGIISAIVSHDRQIVTPLDDSIVRMVCGKKQVLRRARGYVPLPVYTEEKSEQTILASGGDLKAAFCLYKDNLAIMSQYFGDLDDYDACGIWKANIHRMSELHALSPKVLACDMHPRYYSSRISEDMYEYDRIIKVQHHHAHIASVAAEHGLSGNVLGFAFDGTGYGTDKTIWGSEVLLHKGADFERLTHLKQIPMCGGDEVSRDAELALMCYLADAGVEPEGVMEMNADNERKLILVQSVIKYNMGVIYSSSMGRLFDAASALFNICRYNTYEGECAMALEKAAWEFAGNAECQREDDSFLKLPFSDGVWDVSEFVRSMAGYVSAGACDSEKGKSKMAYAFHKAIADAVIDYAVMYEDDTDKVPVALSGGVFANRLLTEMIYEGLTKTGYSVYLNEKVPTNDGGVALGQAHIAAKTLNREKVE